MFAVSLRNCSNSEKSLRCQVVVVLLTEASRNWMLILIADDLGFRNVAIGAVDQGVKGNKCNWPSLTTTKLELSAVWRTGLKEVTSKRARAFSTHRLLCLDCL